MAKLQMQKIEMIALYKDSQNIIERLQRRGVLELLNEEDENLIKLNTNASVAQFERHINTAVSALEHLEHYCGTKASIFDSLNGRKAMSTSQFAEQKEETDKNL